MDTRQTTDIPNTRIVIVAVVLRKQVCKCTARVSRFILVPVPLSAPVAEAVGKEPNVLVVR